MPPDPAPGGPDRLIRRERLRFLACEFEICSDSAEFMERLRYVGHRAEQAFPLLQRRTIRVMASGKLLRLSDDNGEAETELSQSHALETLYNRMHRRAFDCLPDHLRIHAASGMAKDGLFLLVGAKRSGKTTLALRMLEAGYEVIGDELVLLLHGQAVTFPRRFFVRAGSLDLLPQVNALKGSAPFVSNPEEGRLISIDPIQLGRPWRIRAAGVAAILFIEADHQAKTTVKPCGKVEMAQRVLAECTPPASGRAGWIGDLCRTIDNAETVTIQLGELGSAMLAIGEMLR